MRESYEEDKGWGTRQWVTSSVGTLKREAGGSYEAGTSESL